jgi:hypothetical protein
VKVAALYVQTDGCYFGLDEVDPWDKERDARLYDGPWPVVAHPPCERWGRYWDGGPAARGQFQKGDDGGCFEAALGCVRWWGGVLEHPEGSHAWEACGLMPPMHGGGWSAAGDGLGWTCKVNQGNYGHRATKPTWLYAARVELPSLDWRPARRDPGAGLEGAARKRAIKTGICQRLSKKQRAATPLEFRDLLLSIARSAGPTSPPPNTRPPSDQTGGEK